MDPSLRLVCKRQIVRVAEARWSNPQRVMPSSENDRLAIWIRGGRITRRCGKNWRKGRNDGPRINGGADKNKGTPREREKEREGEEEMWAKSVFLSWPAAAKAWPGSTMTHSLCPSRPPSRPTVGSREAATNPELSSPIIIPTLAKPPFRFQIQLVIINE